MNDTTCYGRANDSTFVCVDILPTNDEKGARETKHMYDMVVSYHTVRFFRQHVMHPSINSSIQGLEKNIHPSWSVVETLTKTLPAPPKYSRTLQI